MMASISRRLLTSGKNLTWQFRQFSSATPENAAKYEMILTEKRGPVGLLTLNRPKALNALCNQLVRELTDAIDKMVADKSVGAVVITGSEKAFAAGADIKEMSNNTFSSSIQDDFITAWAALPECPKPLIAAVNGYALGGGCEIAMMCDIIYAGEKAVFGQPEITIGTIPGSGGTQRLTRSVGKSKAMEICLSGNPFTAQEAEKMGLVSKIFPADKVVDEAVKLGQRISSHSPLIVRLCKDAVNKAYETTLQQGIMYERRTFYATFSTKDQKEGMKAFIEKRKPNYTNE